MFSYNVNVTPTKKGMFVVQVTSRLRLTRNKKPEKILNVYQCRYRP